MGTDGIIVVRRSFSLQDRNLLGEHRYAQYVSIYWSISYNLKNCPEISYKFTKRFTLKALGAMFEMRGCDLRKFVLSSQKML